MAHNGEQALTFVLSSGLSGPSSRALLDIGSALYGWRRSRYPSTAAEGTEQRRGP